MSHIAGGVRLTDLERSPYCSMDIHHRIENPEMLAHFPSPLHNVLPLAVDHRWHLPKINLDTSKTIKNNSLSVGSCGATCKLLSKRNGRLRAKFSPPCLFSLFRQNTTLFYDTKSEVDQIMKQPRTQMLRNESCIKDISTISKSKMNAFSRKATSKWDALANIV
ncbi:hypothetical protein T12_17129 [Trichinella patagoniensis]|uniref:Uncharacterized protein n=1 Tax=Trichinella patagoniensis TaxID=990121 RepID=A0A0V0ZBW1_9BILA|nr:hypothetical protein T12_17129 [Trichinella patagoniensis]